MILDWIWVRCRVISLGIEWRGWILLVSGLGVSWCTFHCYYYCYFILLFSLIIVGLLLLRFIVMTVVLVKIWRIWLVGFVK